MYFYRKNNVRGHFTNDPQTAHSAILDGWQVWIVVFGENMTPIMYTLHPSCSL